MSGCVQLQCNGCSYRTAVVRPAMWQVRWKLTCVHPPRRMGLRRLQRKSSNSEGVPRCLQQQKGSATVLAAAEKVCSSSD